MENTSDALHCLADVAMSSSDDSFVSDSENEDDDSSPPYKPSLSSSSLLLDAVCSNLRLCLYNGVPLSAAASVEHLAQTLQCSPAEVRSRVATAAREQFGTSLRPLSRTEALDVLHHHRRCTGAGATTEQFVETAALAREAIVNHVRNATPPIAYNDLAPLVEEFNRAAETLRTRRLYDAVVASIPDADRAKPWFWSVPTLMAVGVTRTRRVLFPYVWT